MSILLTVAALIFVSMLPGGGAGDYNQKLINNDQKIQRIEEATRAFMAMNGRRPCPADGQYPESSQYFGIEAGTPGTCTGNSSPTPNAPLGPDAGTGFIVGGTIPTKSLGIPDDYAIDEFGHFFTYLVDRRVTSSATTAIGQSNTNFYPYMQNSVQYTGTPCAIAIENTSNGLASPILFDHSMYAYISHGPTGYGAWPAAGSAAPLNSAQSVASRINSGSTDGDMQHNAGVDAYFPPAASTFTYSTANFTNAVVKKDRCGHQRQRSPRHRLRRHRLLPPRSQEHLLHRPILRAAGVLGNMRALP